MDIRKIRDILGDKAEPARLPNQSGPDELHSRCRRRETSRRHFRHADRSHAARDRRPPADVQPRAPGQHRLLVDSSGRSRDRALGRGVVRPEPHDVRPRVDHQARDRGRLQRGRVDVRRARDDRAEVRAQDPDDREAQPQRAAELSQPARPDDVGQRQAGLEHGGDGHRRDGQHWGAPESRRQLLEVSEAFAQAHELGMFTVLWCYVRNASFRSRRSATSRCRRGPHRLGPNHLGVTIQADIIKQAEAPRAERRLQRPRAQGPSARRTRRSTARADDRATRSTGAAGSS